VSDEQPAPKLIGLPGLIEVRVRVRSEDGGYEEEQWIPLEQLEGLYTKLFLLGLELAKAEEALRRAKAEGDGLDSEIE
jgi:hypothetical protein